MNDGNYAANHLISTVITGTYLNDVTPAASDWRTALNYAMALIISFTTNSLITLAKDWLLSYRKKRRKRRISKT